MTTGRVLTLAEFVARARQRGIELRRTIRFGAPYLLTPGGQLIPVPTEDENEFIPNEFILYVCELSGLDPIDFNQDAPF